MQANITCEVNSAYHVLWWGILHTNHFLMSNSHVPMCFQPHVTGHYILEPVNIIVYGHVMSSVCLLIEIVD